MVAKAPQMGLIYLIRHGQASFGAGGYDKLSPLGFRQARVLGEALRARLPEHVRLLRGAMVRHQETAESFLEGFGRAFAIDADARWNEYDHEQIIARHVPRYADRRVMMAELASEAKPGLAFHRMFSEAQARWVGGAYDAEYSETYPAFYGRVRAALDDLVSALGETDVAVVFTSGGPIGALAGQLLGVPLADTIYMGARLVNAGLTKMVVGDHGLALSTLNDHGHFEKGLSELITYR